MGRALDTFYDAGAKSIFTALTLRNLLAGSAPLRFAHGNTTSKVMYPMFVDSLFLKTPERIEAPGYVLLIALFVYMTLEERIRTALRQHNLRLEPVRGWRTSKPAAKQVILMLEHIVTIYWYNRETDKWQRQIQQNEKAKQRNSSWIFLVSILMIAAIDCVYAKIESSKLLIPCPRALKMRIIVKPAWKKERHSRINVLVPNLSPADIREIKRILRLTGVQYILAYGKPRA